MLASAGEDGTIRVWDIKTGKQVDMIRAHKPVATVVRFTHDNLSLISGGRDGYVRLWDLPKK
jgi:WD40 repeat protein